jgi:hypothetical protein
MFFLPKSLQEVRQWLADVVLTDRGGDGVWKSLFRFLFYLFMTLIEMGFVPDIFVRIGIRSLLFARAKLVSPASARSML